MTAAEKIIEYVRRHHNSRSDELMKLIAEYDGERAIAESQAPEHDDLGKRAMKVLHDLTPGGSEFYNEPKRCAEYIQEKLDNQAEITKRAIIRAKNAELGDGEPSPPPKSVLLCDCNYCPFCGDYVGECLGKCDGAKKYWRSGAAQEVSPSANFVSEIRPRPDDPSCHVCGAKMVPREWKCLSCGTTTGIESYVLCTGCGARVKQEIWADHQKECSTAGVEEVSPPSPDITVQKSPPFILRDDCESTDEPDAFQEAWAKYNKAGLSTGWERVGFVGGFKHGFDVGRKSAERDTRELKAALKRYGDHDPSCPEFSQKANRHNKGAVHDSAWPCNCGFEEKLK